MAFKFPPNPLEAALSKIGIGRAGINNDSNVGTIGSPWSGTKTTNGTFFEPIEIQGKRWNKLYPYRLLVVRQESNGTFGIVSGISSTSSKAKTQTEHIGPGRFNILFEPIADKWEFRLPITPQQLSITNQFSINTTATLRGIVEEHNGTKFKMIDCSGTFGVWPHRPSIVPDSPIGSSLPPALQTLLGGTLTAINDTARQVNRLVRSITSNHPVAPPTIIKPEETNPGYEGTGYAQALLFDQFLEQYSEAKKDPNNANWRLCFDMAKQNQSFLVTPMAARVFQSADSPNEYKFSLQMKAWRRISIDRPGATPEPGMAELKTDFLQKALTAIKEARQTLASSYNLIRAVRGDFRTVFNAFRELSLFLKELAGLPAAVIDLPGQIIGDAKDAYLDVIANSSEAIAQVRATNDKLKGIFKSIKSAAKQNEGVLVMSVRAGQLGPSSAAALATDPTNKLFESPDQNFAFFDLVNVNELNLTGAQQTAIDNEIARVSELTVDDLMVHRATILDLALQLSNAFGAGDQYYSDLYSRPAPSERLQEMTIDEFAILKSIYDTIQALDVLTATNELDARLAESPMAYVQGLADDSDMTFEDTQAKIRVPVPFNLTVEQIAARYLGDPDRWLEIVTLNSLKSPYLDEDGFELPLLSNASGRQLSVISQENLYIGQRILIVSSNQPSTRRRIIDLEKISDTNFLITLDGLDNLDVFTTIQNARIRAYLPGTVNSQDFVYIPSNLPVPDDVLTRPVPATQEDALVGMSKIDLQLTEAGDIAVNSFGDFRLSYGLNNLVQALRIKFITEKGKLIKHPDFGAGLLPGQSTADVSANDIYNTIATSIESDPRFAGIDRLEVEVNGPQITIKLAVRAANGNGVFPISFQLAG